MLVRYHDTHSGGSVWLGQDAYRQLEAAGWDVYWLDTYPVHAEKDFPSIEEAVEEWEHVTGQWAEDPGCSCCGRPHSFDVD